MLNKPVAALVGLVSILIAGSTSIGFAADLWSEPQQTEQWSRPTQTEQWSQPTQTEQWSQPTQTEQWSQPTQTEQWSQPTQTEQWSQPTQTEQWSQPTQTGQWVQQTRTEQSSQIPWVELWAQHVQTQQSNQLTQTEQWSTSITLAGTAGTTDATDVTLDPALDFQQLYGTWRIWTSGSVAQGQYLPGADQGVVVINKDGTYRMSHAVWAKDGLEGKWRLSFPGEINGLRIIAIVFLNDDGSSDWAVSYAGENKATLMSALAMPDGTAFWIASDQLFRE